MEKKLTNLLVLGSMVLLMLSACKKNDAIVTSNGGKPGALTASTTTLALDKTKLTDPSMVINFSFTAADYGFKSAVTNTLQIDAAGDNWANPASVTLSTNVLSQGYSTADFNTLLLKLNLVGGVTSQVQVRVAHSVSSAIAPVYSNVVNLTVTPFNLASWVYVPGAYEGWGNPGAAEDSLLSATGNGIYTGIINFPAGGSDFLIVPVKGSWANKYATADPKATGTSVTYSTEYVTGGGNNFFAPAAAGYYVVTLNTNAKTLTIAPADFYSVIGDAAQGWGTDVPMKFINDANQEWVVKLPLVSTGAFKIRQDDAWGNSWGIPKAGSAGAGTVGVLNNTSNNNISVTASGTYTVSFSVPITTFGGQASVLATYSVGP